MERRHITEKLSVTANPSPGKRSPDGVKFRTLCERCNSKLLGGRYDPALIEFVNAVTVYFRSVLYLPATMSVRGYPQKIIRSVLGHMSAQGKGRYLKGPNTEPFRDYFLDEALPLPAGIKVYYWLYPFYPQVLIRDAGYMDIQHGSSVVIWLMKFFPLAFLVTWQDETEHRFPLPNFDSWRNAAISDEVDIPLDLRHIRHPDWPENPSDNSALLYGREAIVSTYRKPQFM